MPEGRPPAAPRPSTEPNRWIRAASRPVCRGLATSLLKDRVLLACLSALCLITWDDCAVQGFERADRQLLDAAALAGHLVPAGSMFAFLAAHRGEVFPDEDYADLFAPPGWADRRCRIRRWPR